MCKKVGELVLVIPNSALGRRAVEHLQEHGRDELRCEYVKSLEGQLRGLESAAVLSRFKSTFHLVRVPVDAIIATANRILQKHNGETEGGGLVEAAEPNEEFRLLSIGSPFTLGGKHSDYLKQMRRDRASSVITGAGVRIAVIDSGCDPASQITIKAFYDVEATPVRPGSTVDLDGHGTAMTTLIHAVAPNAELYVVKALDPSGSVPLWNLLGAVAIGVYDCKAHILNLSLGIHLSTKRRACGATMQSRLLLRQAAAGHSHCASSGVGAAHPRRFDWQ